MQINFFPIQFNANEILGYLVKYQEVINSDGHKESNLYDLREEYKGQYHHIDGKELSKEMRKVEKQSGRGSIGPNEEVKRSRKAKKKTVKKKIKKRPVLKGKKAVAYRKKKNKSNFKRISE